MSMTFISCIHMMSCKIWEGVFLVLVPSTPFKYNPQCQRFLSPIDRDHFWWVKQFMEGLQKIRQYWTMEFHISWDIQHGQEGKLFRASTYETACWEDILVKGVRDKEGTKRDGNLSMGSILHLPEWAKCEVGYFNRVTSTILGHLRVKWGH